MNCFRAVIHICLLPLCLSLQGQNTTINSDLYFMNATIVDGMNHPPFQADIRIKNGHIDFIGNIDTAELSGMTVVDASDHILCPGFIDLHAHGDPLLNHTFSNFLAMGVTSIVLGQDGRSPDQSFTGERAFSKWVEQVSNDPIDVNIIPFVGHGSIRERVGIQQNASPSDIQKMTKYIVQSITDGAWGISMGLEYVPGLYADSVELESIAKAVGTTGMIMAHMRSEDDDAIDQAIQEMVHMSKHCPAHISHLKVVYGNGSQRAKEILEQIQTARETGHPLSADMYPYLASYTGIGIIFPKWCKTNEQFNSVLVNREKELRDYLFNRVQQRNGPESTLICTGPYTGMTLQEVAEKEQKSYVDVLIDLGPQGTSGAYFVMDRELQDVFISDPMIAFASDGSPTMRHPRGYGTYARVLTEYVRDQKTMPLQLAIYKMTGLPAGILGLEDRGSIEVGKKADLTLFQLTKIQEKATYVNPKTYAEGFQVWIDGKLSWKNGKVIEKNGQTILRQ